MEILHWPQDWLSTGVMSLRLVSLWFLLVMCGRLSAQSVAALGGDGSLSLTLQDAIVMAERNSPRMQQADASTERARGAAHAARAYYALGSFVGYAFLSIPQYSYYCSTPRGLGRAAYRAFYFVSRRKAW